MRLLAILPLLAAFLTVPAFAADAAPTHQHDMAGMTAPAATAQLPIHMLVKTIWPMRANKTVDCYLYLWTDKGPVKPEEFLITHTKKMHLFLLTPDFKDFYHVHPEPTGQEGEYRFSFQPTRTIPLRAWAEFTTAAGRQVLIADVDNKTADIQPLPQAPQIIQSETADIVFTLHFNGQIRAGSPAHGVIYATHKSTKLPFKELEPILGAFAHIAAFSSDFRTLYHSHPVGPEITDASAMGGPELQFELMPELPGMMKIFAQFKARGEDLMVPFIVRVAPALRQNGHRHVDEEETPPRPPDAEPEAGF